MYETQIDPNTGFLDRYSSLDLVSGMLEQGQQGSDKMAILWLDLDRFKHLNESFGYEGGDSILAILADRIREKVGEGMLVGRVGVDEFMVIVTGKDEEQIELIAVELMQAVEEPLNMGDFRIRLTASIGIAILESEESAAELLERADWAKNTAKKQGGHRYVISGHELVPSHMGIIQAREDLEVEYLLHTALDNGGLQLHYQPILSLNGKVVSVEALMRCNVNGKSLAPGRFFPVAEKSGLISRLGEWSLIQGTRQARSLANAGLSTTVSINVSRGQLSDRNFAQSLNNAIILANVAPNLIDIEFSESVFMDESDIIQSNLRVAREIGVGLVIDNFGSGYSCLASIKDMPATKIKLGRQLNIGLAEDYRSRAVVKSLVSMGKDLGMEVIAEGVETREQLEALKELSVDGIQGYYYARPMDEDKLAIWLTEREH